MANVRTKCRPTAPLELSAEERAYLERQVRRHRVARSLSERCRIILRCTEVLPSKSVAAEGGALGKVVDEPVTNRLQLTP